MKPAMLQMDQFGKTTETARSVSIFKAKAEDEKQNIGMIQPAIWLTQAGSGPCLFVQTGTNKCNHMSA